MQFNNPPRQVKNNMTAQHLKKSIGRSSSRLPLLLISLVFACFVPLQRAHGVVPPPDGGYPGFTTAEGTKALQSLTTGSANTAVGWYSLFTNTGGSFNTGVGAGTLVLNNGDQNTATGAAALLLNTTGGFNTANGALALLNNTGGSFNTATGVQALSANTGSGTTGSANTANGYQALFENTTGNENTATGGAALALNNTGNFNTADGGQALNSNITGSNNAATGFQALNRNLADSNTADGYQALFSNTTGSTNTATGSRALFTNSTGPGNTADGAEALFFNTTGVENTASGFQALAENTTGSVNTAIGDAALGNNTTGSFNIALGSEAGFNLTTGSSHNIDIGNGGVFGDSGTIRIGLSPEHTRTFIAAIHGVTTGNADAIPVLIDSAGQLGTTSSSRRFKKEIRPMDNTSESILALKPVTFHYKSDKTSTPQFGLIAEEVAEVNPDLVVHDEKGEIYTVRYDQVNAMLLNEFLKEHRRVQELQLAVAEQKKTFEFKLVQQRQQIQALAAGLQEVSAQVKLNKAAPQTVLNDN
jgi:hypothetical protein